jgi:hypothetical protein
VSERQEAQAERTAALQEPMVDVLALIQSGKPVVEITPEGVMVTVLIPWSQVVQVVPDDEGS